MGLAQARPNHDTKVNKYYANSVLLQLVTTLVRNTNFSNLHALVVHINQFFLTIRRQVIVICIIG